MSMIKTGIINKNADVKRIEDEEEIEKFAKKSDEQIRQATNEFVKQCSKNINFMGEK